MDTMYAYDPCMKDVIIKDAISHKSKTEQLLLKNKQEYDAIEQKLCLLRLSIKEMPKDNKLLNKAQKNLDELVESQKNTTKSCKKVFRHRKTKLNKIILEYRSKVDKHLESVRTIASLDEKLSNCLERMKECTDVLEQIDTELGVLNKPGITETKDSLRLAQKRIKCKEKTTETSRKHRGRSRPNNRTNGKVKEKKKRRPRSTPRSEY